MSQEIFEAVARTNEYDQPRPDKVMVQWTLTMHGQQCPSLSFGKDERAARSVAAEFNLTVAVAVERAPAERMSAIHSALGIELS